MLRKLKEETSWQKEQFNRSFKYIRENIHPKFNHRSLYLARILNPTFGSWSRYLLGRAEEYLATEDNPLYARTMLEIILGSTGRGEITFHHSLNLCYNKDTWKYYEDVYNAVVMREEEKGYEHVLPDTKDFNRFTKEKEFAPAYMFFNPLEGYDQWVKTIGDQYIIEEGKPIVYPSDGSVRRISEISLDEKGQAILL